MHLVMRPVDTSQAPPAMSGAERGGHPFAGPMGGGFPVAFRGGPSGALNPNDFGSVGLTGRTPHQSMHLAKQPGLHAHMYLALHRKPMPCKL